MPTPAQSTVLSPPTLLLSPATHFLYFKAKPIPKFSIPISSPINYRNSFPVLFCTVPKSTQQQEEAVLQFIAESTEKTLPCVRAFENDLARLSLVGGVSFEQALTAAAADGGQAAAEHIDSGVDAMVVETVFPGPGDEHATISTRLFLPAKKVKEKAGRLKKAFAKDILSGAPLQNILAMTFRQVVLQNLWNFELFVFKPGTERNMEDLENPREVPASFFISSSDEQVISVLAEAVCIAALQDTGEHSLGKSSSGLFRWFQRQKRIASRDSSVIIYKFLEDEIVENAKSLLEKFNSTKGHFKGVKMRSKNNWWAPLVRSKLEKIGGPEFCAWTSEYVPVYRLQIDTNKVKYVKFEGCTKSAENSWEVLLTHSQMAGLAEILDIYFEDVYSLPNKELSCHSTAYFTNSSNKKGSSSLFKILSVGLVSGIFLITINAFSQLFFPGPRKGEMYTKELGSLPSSEVEYAVNEFLDNEKLQEFCVLVVKMIKDGYGWDGDIVTAENNDAWIGEVPKYLKVMDRFHFSNKGNSTSLPIEDLDENIKSSAQEIASYQVVLSTDGKIVGFQPTSRVGVNHWATNPIARELYGGKKLSPGFFERGPEVPHPNEVVAVELLMSVNLDTGFALARPA